MNFTIEQHRTQYLEMLFEGLEGYIEVRSFARNGPRRQSFCLDIPAALRAIDSDFAAGCNVYVGQATRGDHTSDETGRISGGKDNLVQCRALWVDRDGLTAEGAREEWELVLEQFPFKPSLRVDSGGGEHAYWIFEEQLEFCRDDMLSFEYALKGLADVLGCDMAATDASRILRVPGTVNLPSPEKQAKGRVDAQCRIISQTGELYDFDDFADFVTRGQHAKRNAPKTTVGATGEPRKFKHPHRHEALTRHAAFLRKSGLSPSAMEAALLVFNLERCDPPKPDDEVLDLARWAGCVEIGDHNARDAEPTPKPEDESRADRMRRELVESINGCNPIEPMEIDFTISSLAPRYPSAVEGLEAYGNTVLLADAGVGKSMLALGIAMEAAGCGAWEVVYFNAELDAGELATRLHRYALGMENSSEDALRHIKFHSVGDGATTADVVQFCINAVNPARRLLVVIDSINTLAEYAADDRPGSDLYQTRKLYNWSAQVRKNTLGDVSFLVVSESNAVGGVKGRKGFFTSDVVVKLSRADSPDLVSIDVIKSRSARCGPLGDYRRDWKTGRFAR